ncbi:MAG TPA: inositol monophosphatase family protein [Caulobacteraceae bacterium]|nr:inositol monophosphatase family protein [Caulobacteraceae bacterium]
MTTPSAIVKVMSDAARKAGKTLSRDFGELSELQVSRKGTADFVSAADLRAEQLVREMLLRARPGYGFIGEEGGRVEGSDRTHTWIVDPLDGTTNFLHAMPHFAISIALEREGRIAAGVVHNPAANELFWAERGRGAFLNERRIRVAARTRFQDAVIATGIPFAGHGQPGLFLKELHQIMQRTAGVRRFGSAALDLAWVAAGRFDGYWERDLSAWDLAAGVLLVREAGGIATDADGGEDPIATGSICAGNAEIQRGILELLRSAP